MEKAETEKALEELTKATDEDTVYKHAGSIMIKSTKKDLISELEEKKEFSNTRSTVLEKQEKRIRENLKELETKLNEMMRGGGSGGKSPGTQAGSETSGASQDYQSSNN